MGQEDQADHPALVEQRGLADHSAQVESLFQEDPVVLPSSLVEDCLRHLFWFNLEARLLTERQNYASSLLPHTLFLVK